MTNERNDSTDTRSAAYLAACEAHSVAQVAYDKACLAYRALEIGDAEYFAARKLYDAATVAFDAAFAQEAASDN